MLDNSIGLVGISLSGSKLLLIASSLCTKIQETYQEETRGKYLRETYNLQICPSSVTTEAEEFPRTTTVSGKDSIS